MSHVLRRFPDGFLWGTATSAHQVEGGNRLNDWARFEALPGKIADGTRSGDACRHFERFDQDFALAAADGHNAHRLSLEWSRLEPERGRTDPAAVAHYHDVFASLRRHRLTPIVTLHHFTNPLWNADRGGWENRETIDHFVDFVRFCAREYGGEVDWWCTVNEPEVYGFRSYSEGLWPPGKRDNGAALIVMANMLEAHGRAYRTLHDADRSDADGDGRAAMVGLVKSVTLLEPLRPWFPPDVMRARIENAVFNLAIARAPVSGDIHLEVPGAAVVKRHVPELEQSLDFFGLNYYTRWRVQAMGHDPHVTTPGAEVSDNGWEVYPHGFEQALALAGESGAPVLVTENGIADAADRLRPRALVSHLLHMGNAMDRGVRVLGYLHWSLMDNFEWAEGLRARFGLYAVDFDCPERPRTPRPSAALFARIARANAIEAEMAAEVGLAL